MEDWIIDNEGGKPTLVLAHGAGAPYDTPFMNTIAEAVAEAGIEVVRFEFPYMRQRRLDAVKRGPNTSTVLESTWRDVVRQLAERELLFIGGKSMGGRIASMLADELEVAGLICLGYPFHPSGKPETLRTAHLEAIRTPTLIVQGTRDTMGRREEVEGYYLSRKVSLYWLEDGDHSLKPRKRSGLLYEDHLAEASSAVVAFIRHWTPAG